MTRLFPSFKLLRDYPVKSISVGLFFISIPTYFTYLRNKKTFFEKHTYLKDVLDITNDLKFKELTDKYLGFPFHITNNRKGKIDYHNGLAKSTLIIEGPLGKGYLHTSANLSSDDQSLIQDEPSETVSFSDIWNYPYILKNQIIKIFNFTFKELNNLFNFQQEYYEYNKKQLDWKINNCILIMPYHKETKSVENLLSSKSSKSHSFYLILELIGNAGDNPNLFQHIHIDISEKLERARAKIIYILASIASFGFFLLGRQYYKSLQKASIIRIIEHFTNTDTRLTKFKAAKILDMKGQQKNLFLDMEVSILGKQDDIAIMKIRAHRYSSDSPFNVHSAHILVNNEIAMNLIPSGKQLSIKST